MQCWAIHVNCDSSQSKCVKMSEVNDLSRVRDRQA